MLFIRPKSHAIKIKAFQPIEWLPQDVVSIIISYLDLEDQIFLGISTTRIYRQILQSHYRQIVSFLKKNNQAYADYLPRLTEQYRGARKAGVLWDRQERQTMHLAIQGYRSRESQSLPNCWLRFYS